MEDQAQDSNPSKHASDVSNEPIRSRWTPKPEQILILESIFNGGMVNPPKDETVRIRKLLEKFGAVGDANVFYWFQNRRSRSRRRQRQIQASLSGGDRQPQASQSRSDGGGGRGRGGGGGGGAIQYDDQSGGGSFVGLGLGGFHHAASGATSMARIPTSASSSSSSSCGGAGNDCGADGMFSFSGQMGHPQIQQSSSVTTSTFHSSNTIDFQYLSAGYITVFINGVATEVPRGPLDLKAMLGCQDYMLMHSSGVLLPVNEFGFLSQGLQHGESYFVVRRPF